MNGHGLSDGAKDKSNKIEEEITPRMPFYKHHDTDENVTDR